jgi:flagellar basal-body rod modification protein FlgD
MAAATLFNHAMTAGQALLGGAPAPLDSSTTGTSSASGSSDGSDGSATISANDFLTLLVTEMQNQDPTADTDPNEYINQLVEVNSLEQLIDINQTLTTDLGGTSGSSNDNASGETAGATSSGNGAISAVTAALPGAAARTSTGLPKIQAGAASGAMGPQGSAAPRIAGNLSVPGSIAAGQRVAHALDGRVHTQPDANLLSIAH